MSGCAYPLSYTRDTSKKVGGVFHTLGKKVRERFSRFSKPLDHLGGVSPEEHVVSKPHLPVIDENQDLEDPPKPGTSLEDMVIHVG